MDNVLKLATTYGWILIPILAVIFYKFTLRVIFGVVMVGNDKVGIVDKKWVLFGKNKKLPDGTIIALKGEAGIQADTLAPGVHFCLWVWQYKVSLVALTEIEIGHVGVVQAIDGKPLSHGRVLAKTVSCDSFQDARSFLDNGGERGPQISIIPPGKYRINTSLFSVEDHPALEVAQNNVGIVTTKDGVPLATGEIAGKEVPAHNSFQDVEKFIENGGHKGLQEQVILAGLYYINPLFASVDLKPMTEVPIANVGVVIAFVGKEGVDVTGDAFKHGNIVKKGEKGVWIEVLDPGKYPINPYTHRVELVPTANIVLNWATGKNESHKLDEKLSTITVRSADGFTFKLDVSQIIHVPRNDAPKVIARFGNMANLITQVLEPTLSNYFRNAAQRSDVIDFLKGRSDRQSEARTSISKALEAYNVNGIDTLIGDIVPPEDLMKTLTDRKIAEQEQITFETQEKAEKIRMNLEQAKAMAATQAHVVDAERKVTIMKFDAESSIAKADGDARAKKINAEADAEVLKLVGAAEADKTLAIGKSEADVIKLKIESMDPDNFAMVKIAEALAAGNVKLVPEILVNSSGSDKGNGIIDVLLAKMLVNDKKKEVAETTAKSKKS